MGAGVGADLESGEIVCVTVGDGAGSFSAKRRVTRIDDHAGSQGYRDIEQVHATAVPQCGRIIAWRKKKPS
jgi:hypothetical protein